jgi:DHA3 family macrolide efflux protein-like MFS transporter
MTSLALSAPPIAAADAAPRLFNRNFVLLWQAQLVSQFGNQAFTIALMFWTAEAMHSATMSGLMMMASVLPLIVLGPLTGTFVDGRRSRLRIIATCDLLSGAFATLLAVGFLTGPDAWRPTMLFSAALLIGVCNAFFDPAVNALTPDLVPADQIEAANALRQSSRQVTVLGAQGLAGILYALLGPAALFLLNGLSFIFAGLSELLIRPASRSSASAAGGRYGETTPKLASILASEGGRVRKPGFYANVADGFRYVAAERGMVGFLVTTSVFNALLMPVSVLLPVFATTVLGADVQTYGFLLAAIGAGAIAGCAAIGAAQSVLTGPGRRRLLITAFAGLGLALMLLGQVGSLPAALAILFVTGVLSGAINVLVMSIIQRRTSGEFRGRVIGLHTMMTRVLMPIGLVGGGAVADLTGRNVPLVYAICGGVAMATVLLFGSRPATRAFLASS